MTSLRQRTTIVGTLLVGTLLLGASLATHPGSPLFYPLLLAVALTWLAGGFLSGAAKSGRTSRRDLALAAAIGTAAGVAFVAGGALLRLIPVLRHPVVDLFAHADQGNAWLVGALALLNGVAEEVFFRGAVFGWITRRPVLGSTAIYVLVTLATANPMLSFAALVMGTLFGWQRRASGSFAPPLVTHVVWTAIVLGGLPLAVGH